jgi:protein-arginine deiminase
MAYRYMDLGASHVFARTDRAPTEQDHALETVVVLGEPIAFDPLQHAPPKTKRARLQCTEGVTLRLGDVEVSSGEEIDLSPQRLLAVDGRRVSAAEYDQSFKVDYLGADGGLLLSVSLRLTFVRVALLCDANRDGKLDDAGGSSGWSWGSEGRGPVLLVNNDRDVTHGRGPRRDRLDARIGGPLDLEDLAPLAVELEGPPALSARYQFVLQVTDAAAEKIRIFDVGRTAGKAVVEPGTPRAVLPCRAGRQRLAAEGLQYPDTGFSGLVSVELLMTEDSEPISATRVLFRVAPWIMVSNVQRARRVFMCQMRDGTNADALATVANIAKAAKVEFVKVPPALNRGDRWIQDELEIGYSQAPHKTLGVVLDSPRNRELDAFPERLIAPDFGWVTRGDDGEPTNSLESFGNLEVSPPVTVGDRHYPLGRILFGGAHPAGGGRRMMKLVSDFLYAQQVQAPVELYSDWLAVGHVDEFMSFVPAPTDAQGGRGFRLLLASPAFAWRLLTETQQAGHGNLPWLTGKQRFGGAPSDVTVDEVLADDRLREANLHYQRCVDWNRAVLMRELGLTEADIIDLPVLFQRERGGAGDLPPFVGPVMA